MTFPNIKSRNSVTTWVRKYKEHGKKGLTKNQKSSYTRSFKISVVKYMHENHLSLQETAFHFNLGNHIVVKKWEQIYYEEGPQALYESRRGQSKNMKFKSKNELSKDKKTEKELREEIEYLRMENEYLKKLNALVQERIKRENKKK